MAGPSREPYVGSTPEQYEQLLAQKLDPKAIRLTIAVAGVLQIVHEMIKRSVIEQVHGFFWCGIEDGKMKYNEQRYVEHVLDRAPGAKGTQRKFRGSVDWLIHMDAITEIQGKRLEEIYFYRHELTHELAAFIIDIDRNIDVEILQDALSIFRDLETFWIEIEISIGSFEQMGQVSADDVATGSLLLLQCCVDAIAEEWTEPERE